MNTQTDECAFDRCKITTFHGSEVIWVACVYSAWDGYYSYTQNSCENALLKRWQSFSQQDLDKFIQTIRKLVSWPEDQIVLAYLGMSEKWGVRHEVVLREPT